MCLYAGLDPSSLLFCSSTSTSTSPPSPQEQAEDMGNTAQVENLKRQLEELEERAELLDKERSKGLSAIRFGDGEGLGTCQIDAR